MEDCIFCKLISTAELDWRIIAKNDRFIAFLDSNPLVEFHTLVVPIEHSKYIWDVENFTSYIAFAKDVADHMRVVLQIEKLDMLVSGGGVQHAHIHLLPSNPESNWEEIKKQIRVFSKGSQNPPNPEQVTKLKM